MRRGIGILALALLSLSVASTQAVAENAYGGEGGYAVLSGVGAFTGGEGDNGGGLGVRVGGYVWTHISMDAHYEWVHNVGHMLTYDVRILPLTGRLQPYVYGGVGGASLPSNTLTGMGRVGGGLDYYINDQIRLNLDAAWVKDFSDKGRLNHAAVGLGVGYLFY